MRICTTCGRKQEQHRLAMIRARCDSAGGMGTYDQPANTREDRLLTENVELKSKLESTQIALNQARAKLAEVLRFIGQIRATVEDVLDAVENP